MSNANTENGASASASEETTIDKIREVMSDITTYLLVVSIIGSAFTVLTFTVFKEIRTYPIKLVLYLCVCIMIGYTSVNISDQTWIYENEVSCIIIAIFVHYFLLADFFWTLCIAFNFYQMIVRRNREVQLLEKWYHLVAWGIPGVIVLIVGANEIYGNLGEICYITDDWVTFGTFFVPGLIIISINVILFFLIGREIRETLAGAPKTDQRDRKQEFRVYISIFISLGLSWVFGYIEVLITNEIAALIFFIIFSIMTPAQGILIFMFYCVNAKVTLKWTNLFGKWIPCCNALSSRIQRSSSSTSRGSSSVSSSRGMDSASSRTSTTG